MMSKPQPREIWLVRFLLSDLILFLINSKRERHLKVGSTQQKERVYSYLLGSANQFKPPNPQVWRATPRAFHALGNARVGN